MVNLICVNLAAFSYLMHLFSDRVSVFNHTHTETDIYIYMYISICVIINYSI